LEPISAGYEAAMKCAFCLRAPADGTLVRSVNGAYVCSRCAARIAACERAAAVPLVAAGFAEFEAWQESPHGEPRTQPAARRLWSELASFEKVSGSIDVVGALITLASSAPRPAEHAS
jgi:hypothetical protein